MRLGDVAISIRPNGVVKRFGSNETLTVEELDPFLDALDSMQNERKLTSRGT